MLSLFVKEDRFFFLMMRFVLVAYVLMCCIFLISFFAFVFSSDLKL